MQILDPERTLLRSLPNPIAPDDRRRIRDARPGGPAPVVPDTVVPVQRRVSSRGALMVAGQKIHVGNDHAGLTVDVHPTYTTWRVYDGGQLLAEVPRTTSKPIARFKARKPEPPRQRTSAIPRDASPTVSAGFAALNGDSGDGDGEAR